MQPWEWFISGLIFVAEVNDRDLEAGMHEKEKFWAKYGWQSIMTKLGTATVLGRLKSYNGQKGTLHAYGAKNLLIVLLNVLTIL